MPLFCSDEELVQRLAAASEDHAPGSDADLAAIRAEIDTLSSSLNATECDDPFVAEPELVLALERASSIAGDRSQQPTAVDAQVTHQAPQSKRRVLGQYQLLEELGSGGMGTVYRAVHQKLQRTVALKVLPEDRFRSADLVERFEREIRAVGMLHHPNIVAAHDAGEVNGCHFLVMELVDGIDIGQLSSRLGPLPIPEACEITRQA
ncbi:MAG: protein kinase, partial [Planctomycetaceae bacterium]|nr:protein kinase [Planctomycetaceae bacterium]